MMKAENKYITVAYKLYTTDDNGEKELVEEAPKDHPFQFISGLGTTLEFFEKELVNLEKGAQFEFTIPAEEAYGEYMDEHVINLPKNMFEIDGRFDDKMIAPGNVVPLMDSEGHRLNGTVVEVQEEIVIMDMNHPLAGDDLTFVGEVVESREATPEEIQGMIAMISGEGGCNCGCDSCGDGDCGDGGCGGGCN
ncbi:FKBP-type peptidyl-prolyl cis-trans isomerase [Bacteroides sp. OttesenSCG-928-M17]|nr:FKBP-type peptidyl-prolyl cis-trans isomerase [Bacteroides sp. OttesenSCG-928-M17]